MLRSVKNRCIALMVSLGLGACGYSAPSIEALGDPIFEDTFNVEGPLKNYTVNNPQVLDVMAKDGRYYAPLRDNANDKTLHFHQKQGRLDAVPVKFPFVVVVRNIGIGELENTQKMPGYKDHPYIFAGVQVHTKDLEDRTSAHVVVGHRGSTYNTVEGKQTVAGNSWVNDVGANKALKGRADLIIHGQEDKTLRVYWQPANIHPEKNKDRWIPYNGSGKLPGEAPAFTDEVYVGLITYAAEEKGLPFAGTADSWQVYQQ